MSVKNDMIAAASAQRQGCVALANKKRQFNLVIHGLSVGH